MYIFIIALSLASTSKFSSKKRINKEKILEQPKKDTSKDKKEVINNFPTVEGFYYPLLNFNEIKEKGNFFNFHFTSKKEIFPVRKGIVLFVGKEKDLPGYTVVIYHSPGYISFYSNLEEVKVIKGDLIRNIFEPIAIANKNLIFSLKRSFKENVIENIDLKKFLKKRDTYIKT